MFARCHRSMKKSEPAHSLQLIIITKNKKESGKCSCVADAGGFYHHFIGLLLYLAHLKQVGFKSVPDDLTCTMVAQRWSVPRARQIEPQCVDSVLVKKPQEGANYNKFIKSTLYSPARQYPLLGPEEKNKLKSLNPEPLLVGLLSENPLSLGSIQTHFGNLPKGSALSYQQRLTEQYIINDYGQTNFPGLPLSGAGDRFVNSLSICLESTKLAKLQTVTVTLDMAHDLEHKTRERARVDSGTHYDRKE